MIVWNKDTMHLTGEVVPDDWMGSKGSKSFIEELSKRGDVVLEINSPGGDVMAGASIYNAILKHRAAGHKVTAHVTGMAASIASVIAMAAGKVLMGPVSFMMIHEPWTFAVGNAAELTHEAAVLREIGDGLAVAYARKTGKSMAQIKHAMAAETWMNAPDAIAEGFADGYITDGCEEQPEQKTVAARMSGTARIAAMLRDGKEDGVMAVFGGLISDARKKKAEEPEEEPEQEPEQEPEEPEQGADPEEEPEQEPEQEPEDPEQDEEPEEEPEEENPEEPEQGAGEPEDPEQEPEQEEEPEEEDPEKEDPEQARKSAQRRAEIRDWALSLINGR